MRSPEASFHSSITDLSWFQVIPVCRNICEGGLLCAGSPSIGVALLGLGLIVAPAATQGQAVNLVKNPSFEQDEVILNDPAWDQWCTWGYDVGVNSTVEFDTSTSIDGARSLRVDPQGATNWYFMVIYSPMTQKVGTKYTASFWAKGQAPRPITADMKATDNSVTWGDTDFQITTDWTEYHFTTPAQNGTVKLQIFCAGSTVPLWLDFVYVYEGDYVAGIKPSGITARTKADKPTPADKAMDVPQDTALGWTAGRQFAATHDVYLGKTLADVNNASRTKPAGLLVSQGQTVTTYTPTAALDFGQTYYWRIDEVNKAPDNTIFKGNVWSFTVEPYGYPITKVTATASSSQPTMGPEKTIDGSGLTGDLHGTDGPTMWMSTSAQPCWIQYQFDKAYKLYDLKVWNSNQPIESFIGFGAKDVKVEYSTDGTTWTALANVPQFAQGSGMAGYAANTMVTFGGVMAQYVKLTINSTWGGLPTTGLSEVRFSYVPTQARWPVPATGATGLDVSTTLNWRPGRDFVSHKVFFGTDQAAVTDGTAPAKTVTNHAFDPGPLTFGTTYYWRVDEVNTVTYPGDVWSFTTQEFAVVDDFEGYNDDNNRIYDSWIDGYTDGKSGSTVGYMAAPFAEQTIIHGGKQSIPMSYDNTKSPYYSETTRDLGTAQDWTGNGATHMDLWFRGYPAATSFAVTTTGNVTGSWQGAVINSPQYNSPAGMYVVVTDNSGKSKLSANADPAAAATGAWTQWKIPLSDLTAAGVKTTKVQKITIGVGDKTNPKVGGTGMVYIDDIGFGHPAK